MHTETIWQFKTKHFRVAFEVMPENDLDLSFDDTGETREGLESGRFVAFVAKVAVYDRTTGQEIGVDHLGGCIYESPEAFMDHRECGKQNRKWAAEGKTGRCGSYFSDMVKTAIHEARKYQNQPRVPLRVVA